ncbi:MAG: hypothetical protein RIG68_04215 [Imperialibacter sp.]|uniref:hypothetical protein n=1 Tax=Imperialibacter sp. TaxID=2038411 RepID=UPI0032EA902B
MLTRKDFIKRAATSSMFLIPGMLLANKVTQDQPGPIDSALVKDFVSKGHTDLDGTKQMLAEIPTILNATWDWGNGDYETALGGASHMGRPDIAQYLIDKGARLDIFTAAMMGKLDLVKLIVATYPASLTSAGPHGITLMKHAVMGGEAAVEVVEYLKSQGIAK